MTIDVHAHCIPEGVVEALEADDGAYGIEIVQRDGKRRAVISGRVETGPKWPAGMLLQ